jgi:hypothetical protein
MMIHPDFEFLVGVAVGKILVGAALASPLLRSVALAAGAIAVSILYAENGTAGILAFAHWLEADLFHTPDFSSGVLAGAIIAFIVFGTFRRKFS